MKKVLINDNEILSILILMDDIKKELEDSSTNGFWSNFNYTHTNDIITVDYEWGTYEEGGGSKITVDLKTKTIRTISDESTVYGKNENDYTIKIENYSDIEKYFKENFS